MNKNSESENFVMLWVNGNKYLVGRQLADAVNKERETLRARAEAAERERDALRDRLRWIPVEERLPEPPEGGEG